MGREEKLVKIGFKLTKMHQNCIKCIKLALKMAQNSLKFTYKNVPKTIDFGDELWYNNSA